MAQAIQLDSRPGLGRHYIRLSEISPDVFGSLPDDVERNEKAWKEVSTYCSMKFDLLAVINIALQLQNINLLHWFLFLVV